MITKKNYYSVKAYQDVRSLVIKEADLGRALSRFHFFLKKHELHWPYILDSQRTEEGFWSFLLTTTPTALQSIQTFIHEDDAFVLDTEDLTTISASAEGVDSAVIHDMLIRKFDEFGVQARMVSRGLDVMAIVTPTQQRQALEIFNKIEI